MKSNFFLLALVWLLAWGGVQAETLGSETIDMSAERLRIKQQRATHEALYTQAMQACYERFAVFGCQQEAKRVRRETFDELRRQEVVLNDLERQANAVSALQRINQNMSPERQAEQALAREQALQDDLERRTRADEKQAASKPAAVVAVPGLKVSEPVPSSSDRFLQEQRFADKLKEAEQHRLENAKSRIEKGSSSAKPLPVPTGF